MYVCKKRCNEVIRIKWNISHTFITIKLYSHASQVSGRFRKEPDETRSYFQSKWKLESL